MIAYVQAQGIEVWKLVVDGYNESSLPPTNDNRRKNSLNNSKSTNALLNSHFDLIYVKVMHCNFVKEIREKLQNIYEGNAKVKVENLQTYSDQFENLKMKEDDNIVA
jgi:hypothetical protein